MENKTYSEKLKDPRWQKKRLEILNRDDWKCCKCGDDKNTLHVHHIGYKPYTEPWEYDNSFLITLCEDCHQNEEVDKEMIETFLDYLTSKKIFRSMAMDVLQKEFPIEFTELQNFINKNYK